MLPFFWPYNLLKFGSGGGCGYPSIHSDTCMSTYSVCNHVQCTNIHALRIRIIPTFGESTNTLPYINIHMCIVTMCDSVCVALCECMYAFILQMWKDTPACCPSLPSYLSVGMYVCLLFCLYQIISAGLLFCPLHVEKQMHMCMYSNACVYAYGRSTSGYAQISILLKTEKNNHKAMPGKMIIA